MRSDASPRVVKTRAPGSSYILPANPLTKLTDAALEGFVDRKLGEAHVPAAFPIGTRDELETVPPSEPMRAAMLDSAPIATRAADLAVPQPFEPMRSEPLPLPPPPAVRASQVFVQRAVPYRSTELPRLPVESIDDGRANARVPLVSKRVRVRLVAAMVIAPLLGAAAVVAYMQVAATTAAVATTTVPPSLGHDPTVAVALPPVHVRARVESPPTPTTAAVTSPTVSKKRTERRFVRPSRGPRGKR